MRQPAGASRGHTSFFRRWRRVRVRPERSAICSARQVCWGGLRCHWAEGCLGSFGLTSKSGLPSSLGFPDGRAAAPLRRLSSQLFLREFPRNFADHRTSITSTCHVKLATLYGGKLSRRAAARRSLRGAAARRSLRGAARCSDNDDDHDAPV